MVMCEKLNQISLKYFDPVSKISAQYMCTFQNYEPPIIIPCSRLRETMVHAPKSLKLN